MTKLRFIKIINSTSKIFKKCIYVILKNIGLDSKYKSKIFGVIVIFKNIRGWINDFYKGWFHHLEKF